MAAAAALSVVKQIQALADGPPTPEMRECLGQVVSSLLFFLDHPDSRVRLNAARTLLKLSAGYAAEMKSLDVSRARQAINRCKIAELEGRLDEDTQELRQLLSKFLGEEEGEGDRPVIPATSSTVPSDHVKHADRGQVVLKVSEQADGKVRAAMLEKIVALPGVVSVTFEGLFVIVSTLSVKIAADASFLADLLSAVKAQGVEGVSLVSTSSPPTAASSSAAPAASSTAASSSDPVPEAEVEEDEEPAYLDDDEDDIVAPTNKAAASVPGRAADTASVGSANPSAPQWTFFSQSNWMTGRRIQEFDDDPSITARLAKTKRREEEKKAEERSRLGRLSSWFAGGR